MKINKQKNLKVKKKHAEQFFVSLPKKYSYYFKMRKIFRKECEHSLINSLLSKEYTIGFRSIEYIFLSQESLVACLKFLKRFGNLKNGGILALKQRIRIFPDFWLTGKPREVRMGKGKGAVSKKIYFVKRGSIIFEFFYSKDSYTFAMHLLRKCSRKLPFKNSLVYKYW